MQKNVGTFDRVVRVVIAIILMLMAYAGVVTGWFAFLYWAVALAILISGFASFCPIYSIFKISTCPKKAEK